MAKNKLITPDIHLILAARKAFLPTSRFVLFGLFVWLGALKVFGLSTASALYADLHVQLVPSLTLGEFYMVLGVIEVVIGLTIIIKGFERAAFMLLTLYALFNALPLVLLSPITWKTWFVPTRTGEHVLISSALILLAIGIMAQLSSVRKSKPKKVEEVKK